MRRCLFIQIGFFGIAVFLEVLYYPAFATMIDGLMGGTSGPGSSIGYFRDVYVLPFGIALAIGAAILLAFAARRNHHSLHVAAGTVWIVNLAVLAASSIWYFHAIRAAGNYRG